MSTCDTCISPGACCRSFPIPSIPRYYTALQVMVYMATYAPSANKLPGLPFINPRKEVIAGEECWVVSCSLVTEDGLCGDYENRPYWPCGSYEPGQDPLCAHHVPKIGLCPDLKQPTTACKEHIPGRV